MQVPSGQHMQGVRVSGALGDHFVYMHVILCEYILKLFFLSSTLQGVSVSGGLGDHRCVPPPSNSFLPFDRHHTARLRHVQHKSNTSAVVTLGTSAH